MNGRRNHVYAVHLENTYQYFMVKKYADRA
jgi:hypothetical protein